MSDIFAGNAETVLMPKGRPHNKCLIKNVEWQVFQQQNMTIKKWWKYDKIMSTKNC